jgi:hypothetical protein
MSTLMQPSGPLPRRVYWIRRLLVLLCLIVLVATISWVVGRATASGDSATKGSAGQAHTRTPKSTLTTPDGTAPTPIGKRGGSPTPTHPVASAPAAPIGPCKVADVRIAMQVRSMKTGTPNPITLGLTGASVCRLDISATNLVMQVTSGHDRIWSSDDCPTDLSGKSVVIRPGATAHYDFRWDGFRSAKHCSNNVAMAKPGGYWAKAAFLGGNPTKTYFEIKPRT